MGSSSELGRGSTVLMAFTAILTTVMTHDMGIMAPIRLIMTLTRHVITSIAFMATDGATVTGTAIAATTGIIANTA